MHQSRLDTFREELIGHIGQLFDAFSSGVVSIDAMMALYFDMFGHVDAGLRKLVRNKLATLFKPHLASSVLGKDLPKGERDVNRDGYLGGNQTIRSRLENQQKSDAVIEKSVIDPKPKYRPKSKAATSFKDGEMARQNQGLFSHLFSLIVFTPFPLRRIILQVLLPPCYS